MLSLADSFAEYITMRRTLGSEFRCEAGLLRRFAAFAAQHGASHITVKLVLQWAESLHRSQPPTVARAVSVVRRFAAWRAADDARTEVPPARLVRGQLSRKKPFIHSREQLMAVLEAARGLESHKGLRGLTFTTLFALIAVTGMRVTEALTLDRADVDLTHGVLRIRESKFGKSRFVPLHLSAVRALRHYVRRRDEILREVRDPAFFLSEDGVRVTGCVARRSFATASRRVGQRGEVSEPGADRRKRGRGPRIHDLRHRFAVTTMLDWYRSGKDIEREMPRLSTYLGHGKQSDTQWYIEAIPELLSLASERVTGAKRELGA